VRTAKPWRGRETSSPRLSRRRAAHAHLARQFGLDDALAGRDAARQDGLLQLGLDDADQVGHLDG